MLDSKRVDEIVRKNAELQQRLQDAEIQLAERSREVDDLQIQLDERDALIEEMQQAIRVLEEEKKEMIQQFNAVAHSNIRPINEPTYPQHLGSYHSLLPYIMIK